MDLTIRELAERDKVDERTVRRWIEKGAVETRRTPGGRIRIIERREDVRTSSDNRGHSST